MNVLPTSPRTAATTTMTYRRSGRSGLRLPPVSLGLWHNFGDDRPFERQRDIVRRAFDLGVTHFDLANNYGPPPGSAEENFGRMLAADFRPYRDELVISTQGRLRHVARPVRRVGLAQVPDLVAGPVAEPDGPGLRRHLLLAPLRPGHSAGGDDGRAGRRRARARRSTSASRTTTPSRPRGPPRSCATWARRC